MARATRWTNRAPLGLTMWWGRVPRPLAWAIESRPVGANGMVMPDNLAFSSSSSAVSVCFAQAAELVERDAVVALAPTGRHSIAQGAALGHGRNKRRSPNGQRCEAFYAACFSLNSLSFSRSSMVMFLTSGSPSGFLSGFFGR